MPTSVEWPPRRILNRASIEPFFADLNRQLVIDERTTEWCRNPLERVLGRPLARIDEGGAIKPIADYRASGDAFEIKQVTVEDFCRSEPS